MRGFSTSADISDGAGSRTGTGRLRRWLVNLIVLGVSIGGALLFSEAVLRALGNRALYEIYSKPSKFWKYDALLGWSHEPGASGTYIGPRPWPIEFEAPVAINSLGLRGPEVPPAAAPGELRVLFLGDSMVAAFEVEYEQSFVALLAGLLSARLGQSVRTINAGVRGYGTDQSYLYYRERGRALRPDLVVLAHSGNDPVDNMTLHEMRRPFGKPGLRATSSNDLKVVNSPVPHYPICTEYGLSGRFEVERLDGPAGRLGCRLQMLLFERSAMFSVLTISIPWNLDLLRSLYYVGNPHGNQLVTLGSQATSDRPSGRLTMAIIRALQRETASDGVGLVLIGQAKDLDQLDIDALTRDALPIVPLRSIEAPQLEVRWRHDSHYNPEGHRRVAEEIAPVLAAELRKERGSAPSRRDGERPALPLSH